MHISIFLIVVVIAKYRADTLLCSLRFITDSDFYIIVPGDDRVYREEFLELYSEYHFELSHSFFELFPKISEKFYWCSRRSIL